MNVQFFGTALSNRVKAFDYAPPMNRVRLTGIATESGATVSINYTAGDCTEDHLPASPETNAQPCIPVVWDPEGSMAETTEYFHKYLVDSIVANPGGGGTPVETHYSYQGAPAWHHDDSVLTPAKYVTWGDFRGYETVDVYTGAEGTSDRLHTRYRYFRGMNNDLQAGGARRSVTVDGIADDEPLAGFLREELTYNNATTVSGTLNWPWLSAATATDAAGVQARFLDTQKTETRTALGTGGWRTTRTVTTYDNAFGMPTLVDDQGDIAITTDDRCTRTEYARNTSGGVYIADAVSRTETVGVACSATPARPADVISDTRTAYDGLAVGAAPTRGLPTQQQRVANYAGSPASPQYVTETTTAYDANGRPTTTTDALGRTTTVAYTPATGGPTTRTTTTSPDPDGAGSLTPHVTTTDVNPAWGSPTKVTDPNGKVTSATYDGLGRLTAVWQPGRAQGTKTANTTYEYLISTTGVNAVTTKSLTAAEGYLTSVALYDGLLRPRQTQTPSLSRDVSGRGVSDTGYDSRGLAAETTAPWFTTGAPSSTLVTPTGVVPARTATTYDAAGRETAQIFFGSGVERWRTTTAYGGDRVSVDPPVGEVPTTTLTDARGQTTELRQHTGADPTTAFQATKYAYDRAGQLAGVTDASGNVWSYTYDLRGRQLTAKDPDKGTTTTTYDDAGQVTTVKDARGKVLSYTYDKLGRRTEMRDTSATGALRASWAYDVLLDGTVVKGQVGSSTRYSGGASYVTAVTGYDDGYRPLGQSVTLPSTEGALQGTYAVSFAYMPNGQPKSTTLPALGGLAAETDTTYYDAVSKARYLSGGQQGLYVGMASYDWDGKPLQYALGSSSMSYVIYGYDPETNRLTNTALRLEENLASALANTAYTYDQAGNPTSIINTPTTGSRDAQCFTYDGLRRLKEAWTPATASCTTAPTAAGLGGPAPYWFTDSFDAVGNRTQRVSHAAAGNTTTTYTYPTALTVRPHTLTRASSSGPAGTSASSFTYDAAGNTLTRTIGTKPQQTLTWDPEGELNSVATSGGSTDSYLYSADGDRLIRRQAGNTTVYLPGGQELTLSAGVLKATRYYTFGGATVAVRSGSGAAGVTSLLSDTQATAQVSINNSSRAVARRYSDPYGNARGTAPTAWSGDHAFLDKPLDTTGLLQVGARYLDPVIGRFMSVDPVMDLKDPQQWHGYAYANDNPVTSSDPSGMLSQVGDWGRAPARSRGASHASDPGASKPTVYEAIEQSARSEGHKRRRGSDFGRASDHAYRALSEWINSSAARFLARRSLHYLEIRNRLITNGAAAVGRGDVGAVLQAIKDDQTFPQMRPDYLFVAADVATIFMNFRDGGEWDAKPRLQEELGLPAGANLPMGDGTTMNYDVFGNVIYGYMMYHFGIDPDAAVDASHGPGAGVTATHDDPSIYAGYLLALDYPDGPTEDEFYGFMTSPGTLDILANRRGVAP